MVSMHSCGNLIGGHAKQLANRTCFITRFREKRNRLLDIMEAVCLDSVFITFLSACGLVRGWARAAAVRAASREPVRPDLPAGALARLQEHCSIQTSAEVVVSVYDDLPDSWHLPFYPEERLLPPRRLSGYNNNTFHHFIPKIIRLKYKFYKSFVKT